MEQYLDGIVAEFHYWSYGESAERAMTPRREVAEEELREIAEAHGVAVSLERASRSSLSGWIGLPRLLTYSVMVVRVSGDDEGRVKACLREIFQEYGRPDEVPSALFGSKSKTRGRKIIESVLQGL